MREKHARGLHPEGEETEGLESEKAVVEENRVDREGLGQKLEAAEKLAEALRQEGMRIKADFMNYRSRIERESQKMRVLAAENAVLNLIPVLDNLDRAIEAAENHKGESLLEGVRMVREQFYGVLRSLGLEEIPAIGEAFNPEVHDGVMVSPVDDPDGNERVLEVVQKGYRLGERVIRPSKVRVGRYDG